MSNLNTFLDHLDTVKNPESLQGLIETLRDTYSINHVVYHALNLNDAPFAALTYTPKWVDHYLDKNYIRVDPVVKAATQQFHPMDWQRLDWGSKGSRAFLGDAIDAGIGNNGLSIPIRGKGGQFALFTINHDCSDSDWEKFAIEHKRDMMLISHYIHQKANDLVCPKDERLITKLSPREADALTYLSQGMTRNQVAEKLQISENTLRVYIDTARHKLGALNLTHAVALALSKSLIVP